LYSNEENGLQQFQMESCQPIKRLKDKKKKKKKKEEEKKKKVRHVKQINRTEYKRRLRIMKSE